VLLQAGYRVANRSSLRTFPTLFSDTEYQISEGNRIMVIDKLQNSIGPGEENSWCLMFTSGIGGILAGMKPERMYTGCDPQVLSFGRMIGTWVGMGFLTSRRATLTSL